MSEKLESNPYRQYEKANGKNINYTPGDSKPDFTDKKGKDWMAKKDETLPDLKKRAAKDEPDTPEGK